MNIETAVDLIRTMILTSLVLVSPIMAAAVITGVTISLIQSVTSIQEQTLTFVPKLVAVGMVILVASNWMIQMATEVGIEFIQKLPDMAP